MILSAEVYGDASGVSTRFQLTYKHIYQSSHCCPDILVLSSLYSHMNSCRQLLIVFFQKCDLYIVVQMEYKWNNERLRWNPTCLDQQCSRSQDLPNVSKLLESNNINRVALEKYARDAANFFTNGKLKLEFVKPYTVSDVSIFDYARPQKAVNASLVKEREGKRLLFGLVGDSLVEVCY